jgi:hypothetical protein
MAQASVPADATAVILNVTATNTTAASFFTVYPTGTAQPLASDLNWIGGKTVPNLVVVKLGTAGVALFNQFGSADAIVDILGYFSPPPVSVSANPSSIPADGSSRSVVTATVTRSDGTPVASDFVAFTTAGGASCGSISGSPATTNTSGIATVAYTSSTTVGTCSVTATEATNSLNGSITITQTKVANSITETTTPSSVPADGKTTSSVTSTVTNRVTGPVAGTVVTYVLSPNPTGSCGALSATSATTGPGGTTPAVTYTATSTVGFCTISATEAGTGSGTSSLITQHGTAANTAAVTASPNTMQADGMSTATLAVTVTGSAAANDLVAFTLTPSIAGACGTLSAGSAMTSAGGVATVTYTASNTAGTCTVTATEAAGGSSATAAITQT